MRGTVRYRGKEQRVLPFVWKLYYFRPNVILLSSESYITFPQKLYYFSPKPIGVTDEGSIEPS